MSAIGPAQRVPPTVSATRQTVWKSTAAAVKTDGDLSISDGCVDEICPKGTDHIGASGAIDAMMPR